MGVLVGIVAFKVCTGCLHCLAPAHDTFFYCLGFGGSASGRLEALPAGTGVERRDCVAAVDASCAARQHSFFCIDRFAIVARSAAPGCVRGV
jgi:hypothetical protein